MKAEQSSQATGRSPEALSLCFGLGRGTTVPAELLVSWKATEERDLLDRSGHAGDAVESEQDVAPGMRWVPPSANDVATAPGRTT